MYFEKRVVCPICSSKNNRIIYRCPFTKTPIKDYLESFYSSQGMVEFDYLSGASYTLVECLNCGLLYQEEVPNSTLLGRLYEQWIDPLKAFGEHQRITSLHLCSQYAQDIMTIIAYLGKTPMSLDFFDFGMGWGSWAMMAKAFGCNACGSELSHARVEFAESQGICVIEWKEIPNYQFDFINIEQVFEHLSDPLETLLHLKRALKTNGLLRISVPTVYDMRRRLKTMNWKAPKGTRNSLNAVAPLEHINCYTRKSLLIMACRARMQETSIPVVLRYKNTTDWNGVKQVVKNLIGPVWESWLKKKNVVYLRLLN